MSNYLGRSRSLSREWWYAQKKADINARKNSLTGDPMVRLHAMQKTFTHADLTAAAASEALVVTTLPAGAEVVFAFADLTVVFAGASSTAVQVEIGETGGDVDLWFSVDTIFTDAALGRTFGTQGPGATGDSAVVSALFTATSDNVVDLTTGSITIHIVYTVI